MRVWSALLAALLLAPAAAVAQRTVPPSPASAALAPVPPVAPVTRADSAAAEIDRWRALSDNQRTSRRVRYGLLGAFLGTDAGLALGAGAAHAHPKWEGTYVSAIGLGAIGETIGITLGAAAPGAGTGRCSRKMRVARSFVGVIAGTAAGSALVRSQHHSTVGADVLLIAVPLGQISGAMLALEGC